jgi:eukaryotic-like serine/threonine-protein kinase
VWAGPARFASAAHAAAEVGVLSPGTKLGTFEVAAKLGEGGMGEIWRAVDNRLGREVALKMLPQAFADDPERHARFEREAKVLASLNHPNIATLFGLEHIDGRHVLVMELVAGEDIAQRLLAGPIPVDEAIPIARQIAEALEAAHDKGIVHRDLKPANVKVTPEGTVKVLDFGLAKALDPALSSGAVNPANSPTMATATQAGLILGTAAYMAPEQARGGAVDKRADIWAFGAVLFEMLTGRQLFRGDTVSDTLAAVLRQEIDWHDLPDETPPAVHRLLARCLVRDRNDRLHDIADARLDLAEPWAGREAAPAPGTSGARRLAGLGAAFVGGAAVMLAAAWLVGSRGRAVVAPTPRVAVRQLTFQPGAETMPAISPDGESFVYAKAVGGHTDLFLQRVDGRNPIDLTAGCAEDDRDPAFSPDGRQIAYRSDCGGGGIFVMGATGESPRRVTDFGFTPSWSPDGREVVVATERPHLPTGRPGMSQLWAVTLETGARRLITEHDAMHPSWSPDGRRIAFWGLHADSPQRDLWTVAADGSQAKLDAAVAITDDAPLDWDPVWAPDGRSLFFSSTRGGTFNLWRIAVDPSDGRPRGAPEAFTVPSSWVGWISVSRDGRRILWVDRNARTAILRAPVNATGDGLSGPFQPVPLGSFEVHSEFGLSPDGASVIFSNAGLPQNLFVARADGSSLVQLTDGPHRDRQATWAPDGSWIVFQSDRWKSQFGRIRPDGSGLREVLSGVTMGYQPQWSPDGRQLAAGGPGGAVLIDPGATDPEHASRPLPPPPDGLAFWPSSWSPDGRLLAGGFNREATGAGVGILSLADGAYTRLPGGELAARPQFLADGRHLVLSTGSGVALVDRQSGSTRELLAAQPGHQFGYLALSADRRWVAAFEAADESDIWLTTLDSPGGAKQ